MNEISNPNKGVYSRRTFLKFAGTGAAALALAACAVPAALPPLQRLLNSP